MNRELVILPTKTIRAKMVWVLQEMPFHLPYPRVQLGRVWVEISRQMRQDAEEVR